MKTFLFYAIFLLFALMILNKSYAITMSDQNFRLKTEIIDTEQTIPAYKIDLENSQNRQDKAQTKKESRLTFSVSPTLISYGQLLPGEAITRTNQLKVASSGLLGYSIKAWADHPPKSEAGDIIPGVSCDSGVCNQNFADVWNNPLAYGFGYNCYPAKRDPDPTQLGGCLTSFIDSTYFKRFPSLENKESATDISGRKHSSNEESTQITYKINIPISQAQTVYKNSITYVVVPKY